MSLVLGAVLVTAIPTFILVEKRMRTPFIPFKLLRVQTNLAALAINTAVGFAFFGSITVVPPLLHWAYGLKPTDVGLLLAPTTLSWVLAANVSSRLVGSKGPRIFLALGGALFTSALLLSIFINLQIPNPYLLSIAMALVGGSMGLIVPATLIALQTLAEPQELGFITSILTFVRSLSGAIGTQVMWAPYALIYNLETFSFVEASRATVVSFGAAALVLAATLPFVLRVRWPDLRLYDRSRPRIQA
jgi:MFS family permease